MGCLKHNISIEFKASGIKIRPYEVNINRSFKNEFDSVRCKVTNAAASLVADDGEYREPVHVMYGPHKLYEGYLGSDSVRLGDTLGWIHVQDPLRILQSGTVDEEWTSVSAQELANHAIERVDDPHNVISNGDPFIGDGNGDTQGQHEISWYTDFVLIDGGRPEDKQRLENWVRDWIPLTGSDNGRFDFREATPYDVIKEICQAWEVHAFVEDGRLHLQHALTSFNEFGLGMEEGLFRPVKYNLPTNMDNVRGVIAKGATVSESYSQRAANLATPMFDVSGPPKQARGIAEFKSVDTGAMIVADKSNLEGEDELKEAARRRLLSELIGINSGNVEIDVIASTMDGEWVEKLKPGDVLNVALSHWDCLEVRDGLYEIDRVQHRIDGNRGWNINLGISLAITDRISADISTRYKEYSMEDPEHTNPDNSINPLMPGSLAGHAISASDTISDGFETASDGLHAGYDAGMETVEDTTAAIGDGLSDAADTVSGFF